MPKKFKQFVEEQSLNLKPKAGTVMSDQPTLGDYASALKPAALEVAKGIQQNRMASQGIGGYSERDIQKVEPGKELKTQALKKKAERNLDALRKAFAQAEQ